MDSAHDCTTCCWNSLNNYFEPDIVFTNNQAWTEEACITGVPGYPNRRQCEFWAKEPVLRE